MTNTRRRFLGQLSLIAGAATLNNPFTAMASVKRVRLASAVDNKVDIYHTCDLNGNLNATYKNMGGLNHIKAELAGQNAAGLLLDGGSFLNSAQTYQAQKQVIHTMNSMGYHAAALGSHELAIDHEQLLKLATLAQFTLVNCNYGLGHTLKTVVKPYIIIHTGKLKIGITGVGQPNDAVVYNDAVKCANKTAALLKNEEKCNLVICLSHLGNKGTASSPGNHEFAMQSENIDMIIGGGSQKIVSSSLLLQNRASHEVFLCQAGLDGLMIGKMEFSFNAEQQKEHVISRDFIPGKPAQQSHASALQLIHDKGRRSALIS